MTENENTAPQAPAYQQAPVASQAPVYQQAPQPAKNKTGLIVAVILIVAAIVVACIFLIPELTGDGKTELEKEFEENKTEIVQMYESMFTAQGVNASVDVSVSGNSMTVDVNFLDFTNVTAEQKAQIQQYVSSMQSWADSQIETMRQSYADFDTLTCNYYDAYGNLLATLTAG